MQTHYTILFHGPEGTLTRLETRPCADLKDAIKFALLDCGLCSRITIYGDNRTQWTGSPMEAERFLAKKPVAEEARATSPM